MPKRSIIYEATMNGISTRLVDLVIETHNTARLMPAEKCNQLEIQTLRNVADLISTLENEIRSSISSK